MERFCSPQPNTAYDRMTAHFLHTRKRSLFTLKSVKLYGPVKIEKKGNDLQDDVQPNNYCSKINIYTCGMLLQVDAVLKFQ